MAITTLDGYIGSAKQRLIWMKSSTRSTAAAMPYTVFDIAGSPGGGTLAIGNTTSGVVPTDDVAGYPIIGSFGGAKGYISRVEFGSSVACRFEIYDRVFAAGAYAYNADVTLSNQPSFASRLPNGSYRGLELWMEAVTTFTGTPSIQINYLDQDGNAGDTGVVSTGVSNQPAGRMFQLPLAAGDNGIQRIDRVRGSVATGGNFNVMILRPLWSGRCIVSNGGDVHDLLRTGLVEIYEDSALYVVIYTDGTSTGYPHIGIEIAVG